MSDEVETPEAFVSRWCDDADIDRLVELIRARDAAVAKAAEKRVEMAEKRCERLRAALIELDKRLGATWNQVDGMIRLATNRLHADDDEAGQ